MMRGAVRCLQRVRYGPNRVNGSSLFRRSQWLWRPLELLIELLRWLLRRLRELLQPLVREVANGR